MKYGYIRVSTKEQDYIRQELPLKQQGIFASNIFEEKISGTKQATERIEFNKMLSLLQPGDECYFESMSRLARSVQDLISTTNLLVKSKKVKVVFLKENLTIGNSEDALSALIFNIMGAFAQFERDLISDRTKQGLKARRELLGDAFKIGRPSAVNNEKEIADFYYMENATVRQTANKYNISISTVSRIINKYKGERK